MSSKEIVLNKAWVELLDYLGIDNRYKLTIQNKTSGFVRVWANGVLPSSDNDGYVLKSLEEETFTTNGTTVYVYGYGTINITYVLDPAKTISDTIQVYDEVTANRLAELKDALVILLGSSSNIETLNESSNNLITNIVTYTDQIEGLITTLGSNTDELEYILNQLNLNTDEVETLLKDIKARLPLTLGSKPKAESLSVTLANDQDLPLPQGAATSEKQTEILTQLNQLATNDRLDLVRLLLDSINTKQPALQSGKTPVIGPLTNNELRAAPIPINDATDQEYLSIATSITEPGDTVLYTPSLGKRLRIHWIYAINDPVANTSTKITIKLGTSTLYVAWAISKRQRFTGAIDAPLIINLSQVGDVAVTAFIEEI